MRHPPGKEMVQRARRLRREMTDAERLLWSKLRASQLGVKFRTQMWLGGHVADFASVEAKLVVEVDGGQHDRDREKDTRRARRMAALGYRTIRFWNHDVLQNIDGVMTVIQDALPSPQPSSGRMSPRDIQVVPGARPTPNSPNGRGATGPRSGGRVRE